MKRDELEQCLRGWKVRLRDSAHDVEEIQRRFYASKGAAAVRSLEKNGFTAHYAASRGEAAALLLSLIPDGAVVGVGDSHTIYALDLDEKLAAKGCQAIPSMAALTGTSYDCNPPGHYRAPTREEAGRILAAYLTADVFLLGANAITMTGEIVNVDGVGSRVVGGIYGPDRIVVVAGINKLVPDERAARERIAFVAAPMNNLKYDRACACVNTGRCPSCDAPNRICNVTTILHKKPMRSDYHVILSGESRGFCGACCWRFHRNRKRKHRLVGRCLRWVGASGQGSPRAERREKRAVRVKNAQMAEKMPKLMLFCLTA